MGVLRATIVNRRSFYVLLAARSIIVGQTLMTTRPFLGETHDRDRALTGFETIEITVKQDEFERYARYPSQREQHFTKDSLPRRLGCLNPRCQQGGLDLQQIVEFYASGEHRLWCNGHEGSPAGRRKGDPCDNRFTVSLSTVRRVRKR